MYHYRLRIIFIITVLRVIFIITVLNYMYHYRLRIIFIIIVNVRPIKRFFKIHPGNEKSKRRNFSSVGYGAIYKTVKARQLLREAKKHFFVAYYNNCGIFQ